MESNRSKLSREMDDTDTKCSFLKQNINVYIRESSRLQAEADVLLIKKRFFFFDILDSMFDSFK